MGSEHLQNLDVSWGHEPVGIPLNRPPGTFSPTGGEGRGGGGRFMESLHDSSIAHWDHEPNRSRSRSRPPPRNQVGRSRTSSRTRTRTKGRFMESGHLQKLDVS